MPVRAETPAPELVNDHGYRSAFSHESELLYPGYYSVFLETPRVQAELLAAGTHAGYHRYTYEPSGARTILLDVCHAILNGADHCLDAVFNAAIVDGMPRTFENDKGARARTMRRKTPVRHPERKWVGARATTEKPLRLRALLAAPAPCARSPRPRPHTRPPNSLISTVVSFDRPRGHCRVQGDHPLPRLADVAQRPGMLAALQGGGATRALTSARAVPARAERNRGSTCTCTP